MARDVVGNAVIALIDRAAPNLNLLLPTGWPTLLFQFLLPEGQWLFLLLLVPLGAALGTLKHSLRRLQTLYDFGATLLQEAPDLVVGSRQQILAALGRGRIVQAELRIVIVLDDAIDRLGQVLLRNG